MNAYMVKWNISLHSTNWRPWVSFTPGKDPPPYVSNRRYFEPPEAVGTFRKIKYLLLSSCLESNNYLLVIPRVTKLLWGTRWRGWLRHCATSRKVASLIHDGVIGFCHWHNPSGRTMAPGVDSNSNEYQECFLEGKGGRCVGLTTSPHSCADCLEIWEPQLPGTLRACPGL